MTAEELLRQLEQGATLEGPHWTEPVKVLTAKARGSKIEVQAVGLRTKRLWTKLLKAEEFDGAVKLTQAGQLAALDGNPTHFRLAAEAHRIRLAFQYDPHFAVSVSQQADNRNVGLALTVLQRRLASSLAAIRMSLERRHRKLKELQRLGKLKQEFGELPEDLDDLAEADRWHFEDDLVERVTMAENMAELEAEIEELDRLVKLAKHTERNVPETKFEELRSVISEHLSGRLERLLVFTEHKDTLDFLDGKLTNLGFHCCTIHGEMPLEKRIASEREFFEKKPSILVATEAAGEGINLQFCSLMVNYDIPWNPNRLEQRMGRIRADMEDKALGSRYIDMSKLLADQQQSKEHRLMPEYIEKFFVEAYRSFGGSITPVKDKKGVWSISRVPSDLRKLPDHLERKYGKVGTVYDQITFDKELVVGYTDLEFIGPGHPLFEGVVERVLQDYGSSLRQGAVFYNADATEPTILWLLKCGVEDGRGHPVGERLFAIHLTAGKFRKSQPYALLDLKTPEAEPTVPADIRQSATDEDSTIEWSLEEVTLAYFGEITDRRTRELAIKEKYVRKSLQFLISESAKKITKYDRQIREINHKEHKEHKGAEPEVSSSLGDLRDLGGSKLLSLQGNRAQEEVRRTELSLRLKNRLTEIEQERHISEKPPEVMGVAVILPPPRELVASVEGMVSDPEIERIAIEVAKQYEIDQGRKPVSVEEENCGWDVTSLLEGQVSRYIEVKGRAEGGSVALTPNEWIKAQRFGKDYWLYVVVNCGTKPELYLIQDPASKLSPKEEVSVVRYMIGQGDWKKAAESTTKDTKNTKEEQT